MPLSLCLSRRVPFPDQFLQFGVRLLPLAQGPLVLAVGPEAGFDSAEEQLLAQKGFVAARLGPRILRTETAALAALAALNAIRGDF